jgi:hypothetical protein
MKFEEGDSIIVLATREKGTVVEWINKKMLLIDVDGVRFPVYADQVDFPYYDNFTQKKKDVAPKKYLDDVKTEKESEDYATDRRNSVHHSCAFTSGFD